MQIKFVLIFIMIISYSFSLTTVITQKFDEKFDYYIQKEHQFNFENDKHMVDIIRNETEIECKDANNECFNIDQDQILIKYDEHKKDDEIVGDVDWYKMQKIYHVHINSSEIMKKYFVNDSVEKEFARYRAIFAYEIVNISCEIGWNENSFEVSIDRLNKCNDIDIYMQQPVEDSKTLWWAIIIVFALVTVSALLIITIGGGSRPSKLRKLKNKRL